MTLTEEQENELGRTLLSDEDDVSGVSFTSASSSMLTTVMDNMDHGSMDSYYCSRTISFSSFIQFINSNISERIRELATIKVLGFYDREVYEYIGRETIILTILGMLVGLVGGYYLTMYILKTCELDMLMFDPEIRITSYILGILITVSLQLL